MNVRAQIPLIGLAAYSGTGKTTLLEQLIPRLRDQGLRVTIVKHAHHDFDIDYPGKDSYRLRKAGAYQTLVASGQRWALITETAHAGDPSLPDLLAQLDQDSVDLILVEGFKHESMPRIELHREALNRPWLYPGDPDIIAVASDTEPPADFDRTALDLNNIGQIAQFLTDFVKGYSYWEQTHE